MVQECREIGEILCLKVPLPETEGLGSAWLRTIRGRLRWKRPSAIGSEACAALGSNIALGQPPRTVPAPPPVLELLFQLPFLRAAGSTGRASDDLSLACLNGSFQLEPANDERRISSSEESTGTPFSC